jgi:hypothetical protein
MSSESHKSEIKASIRLLKENYLDKVSSSKYNQKLKDLISDYQSLSPSLKNPDLSPRLNKLQKKLEKLQKKLPKYVIPHNKVDKMFKKKREAKAESKVVVNKEKDRKKVVVFDEDQN